MPRKDLRQTRLVQIASREAASMDQLYAERAMTARLLQDGGTGTGDGTGTGTGSGSGGGTGGSDATGTGSGSGTGSGTGTGTVASANVEE